MASNCNIEDYSICPICCERMVNPKYLSCRHSFCCTCLNTYILSQGQQRHFECPVCRQSIHVPDKNMSLENVADFMPNNRLIVSLMERSSLVNTIECEKTCEPCAIDNQTFVATSWCTDCQEALCQTCSQYHKRQKQLKHHELVPMAEISKQEKKKLSDVDEPCIEHSDKVLEVYCVDHKQMCCVICLATKHRTCENISTVEQIIKEAKDGVSIDEFAKQLEIVNKKMEILSNITVDNIRELDVSRTNMVQNLTSIIDEAREKLEKLKEKFVQQVNQIHKEQNEILIDKNKRIEAFNTSVKKGLKMLKAVYEEGSAKQVFITKVNLKTQLKSHMELLEGFLNDNKNVGINLHLDDTLTAVTRSMTSVAEVKVKTTSAIAGNIQEVISAVNSICPLEDVKKLDISVDFMSLEATKSLSIFMEGSCVAGGTFLPDGRLVLCDNTNSKLKMYSGTSRNMLFEFKLSAKPWDAQCYSSDKLIVSFYEQSYLKLFTVESDCFKQTGTIPCSLNSHGIAVVNDKIIVANANSIDAITMEGKCLYSVKRVSKYPRHVAVSSAGDIYYSEGDNIIVCRSSDNKEELFRYSDPSLKNPAGITLDNYGNVYVCDLGSGIVRLITSDGKKGRSLIEKLRFPCGIRFAEDGKRFFVSNLEGGRISVDIYKLAVKT